MKGFELRLWSFKSCIIMFNYVIIGIYYKNFFVFGRVYGIWVVDKVGDGFLVFMWFFIVSFNMSLFDGILSF